MHMRAVAPTGRPYPGGTKMCQCMDGGNATAGQTQSTIQFGTGILDISVLWSEGWCSTEELAVAPPGPHRRALQSMAKCATQAVSTPAVSRYVPDPSPHVRLDMHMHTRTHAPKPPLPPQTTTHTIRLHHPPLHPIHNHLAGHSATSPHRLTRTHRAQEGRARANKATSCEFELTELISYL